MNDTDEMLLAVATKTIIDAIHFTQHENIKEIYASYDYNRDMHKYIPKIIIKMKNKCCCDD